MMNHVILVGRITGEIKIENDKTYVTLAVPRPFKNQDGIYETDFIKCILWNGIAERTCEYCKKGDVVSIKGRLQSCNGKMEVVAERISFLTSKGDK